MPVNTAALKSFAPAMRRQLLEAVGRKLDLLLNSQTPDTLSTYARQIAELREQEAENREQLLERVAYTWFNRLCALRYLDARSWHPFGCKVLMPAGEGETQPELLKLMRAGSLPSELKPHTNEARLHGLLDGQIPPAIAGADPQGEVYRELVLASCRSYHQLLPELFEGLDDASELLLPDDLLSETSIAGGFRNAISDTDCEDVEIIGWLYQFYISEKKDQVIGKVVKSEDIPAATQLFTPNWIVKYMVQNSLGAQWLATYPESPLKEQMEYYIEPAEQRDEVKAHLAAITPEVLNPEELTLIDPACGSGHILVEAYDLLKAIYLERGYRQRDIPKLILTKNIYGLDICPRAAQLATFSLLMKGREDDRRFLEHCIKLNVMALQNSTTLNVEHLAESIDLAAAGVSRSDVQMLAELFTHATTFGSLIQVPSRLAEKLAALSHAAEIISQDLFTSGDLKVVRALVRQGLILSRQYEVVVANPPYMGSKGMNTLVKQFTKARFPCAKSDLFACFIERSLSLSSSTGRMGFMSPFVWMFISSHEDLRIRLVNQETITSLVQLEYSGFEGATVPICTFTLRKEHIAGHNGCFIRLSSFRGAANQAPKTLEAINNRQCGWFFEAEQDKFSMIPGCPVAYWAGNTALECFRHKPVERYFIAKKGMAIGDNARFLRTWQEVNYSSINFKASEASDTEHHDWYPCLHGGSFRKWGSNREFVVKWRNNGQEPKDAITQKTGDHWSRYIISTDYFFREGLNWSAITSGGFSARHHSTGFAFTSASMGAFSDTSPTEALIAMANSCVGKYFFGLLSPTLNYGIAELKKLPLSQIAFEDKVVNYCKQLVSMSDADWNSFEQSWDFQELPLLLKSDLELRNLRSRYSTWKNRNMSNVNTMKQLEEDINRLFIDAYGLHEVLISEAPVEQISLTVNPAYRYGGDLTEGEQWSRFLRDTMAEFLSYATGCMMGRYSLDQPGLILADSRDSQASQLGAYEEKVGKPLSEVQFKPDPDAIIPVLDGEWFEDDIVARTREFLEVTFPESTVTENLRFIEESLGKDIRKYFCTEFYKDHLQTYKKRPIYWMVQSPKKGFACLIYLHRYTKDTLNQVLNNYFRPYLQKLEARLAQLGLDQLNDSLPTRERTAARKEAEKITKVLKECEAWEQDALLPLAQQRIELDLDDGVKVNYLKLQDVLAPIPGLAAKED